MKKMFVLCFGIAICSVSFGQLMVGDVDINSSPDVRYIELTATRAGKLIIAVDFGQDSGKKDLGFFLTGPDKQKIEFKSPMEALNYLAKKGWELVNAYLLFGSGRYTTYYVLKKKQ